MSRWVATLAAVEAIDREESGRHRRGLLGGFLGRLLGLYREGDPVGFFMAVLGSIILLMFYRLVGGGRPSRA